MSTRICIGTYYPWVAKLMRWYLKRYQSSKCQGVLVFRGRRPKKGYHHCRGGGVRLEHARRISIYITTKQNPPIDEEQFMIPRVNSTPILQAGRDN